MVQKRDNIRICNYSTVVIPVMSNEEIMVTEKFITLPKLKI